MSLHNVENYIRFDETSVTLTPPDTIPGGTVSAIPSKSHAHRLLIAAALSKSPVHLVCPVTSKDIDATAECMRALMADVRRTEDGFLVCGQNCHSEGEDTSAIHRQDVPSEGDGVTATHRQDVPSEGDGADAIHRQHVPSEGDGADAIHRQDVPSEGDGVTATHRQDVPSEGDGADGTSAAILHVGESGSTLRFLLPVLGALGRSAELHMQGRLSQRPLSPLYEEMCRHGVTLSPQGSNPLQIRGQLSAGTYVIDGGVSSQYITGLLFALPLLPGDSRLVITGKLESRPYVDITLQVLREFGISVRCMEPFHDREYPDASVLFEVPGNQTYRPGGEAGETDRTRKEAGETDGTRKKTGETDGTRKEAEEAAEIICAPKDPKDYRKIRVEGDWSNAAFFLAAGALLESPVTVTGCNLQSSQGDKAIVRLLQDFGADIRESSDEHGSFDPQKKAGLADISVCCGKPQGILHGIDIDAAHIPDLVPILSVVAACAEGTTTIRNIQRLRIKESDRVATVLEMLKNLGCNAILVTDPELPSGEALQITGQPYLRGGTVSSHNDHRIAMAAAIASLRCREPVIIQDPMAVRKSYPGFYEDLAKILLAG